MPALIVVEDADVTVVPGVPRRRVKTAAPVMSRAVLRVEMLTALGQLCEGQVIVFLFVWTTASDVGRKPARARAMWVANERPTGTVIPSDWQQGEQLTAHGGTVWLSV